MGVLCSIGCPVQSIREVFSSLHLRRHTCASVRVDCLRFASLWRANSCGDSCVLGVHLLNVCWGVLFLFVGVHISRVCWICGCWICQSVQHPEKSFTLDYAFIFSGMIRHCLWKMCVTPVACINETGLFSSAAVVPQSKYPSCVARRPFGVTQSKSAELIARGRHFIMTCDIFGTETNEHLALCYLFGKTYKPAYSSSTQVTEINTLDQINEKVILTWAHTFHWRLCDSLETCERCGLSEPVFKYNSLCSSVVFGSWI